MMTHMHYDFSKFHYDWQYYLCDWSSQGYNPKKLLLGKKRVIFYAFCFVLSSFSILHKCLVMIKICAKMHAKQWKDCNKWHYFLQRMDIYGNGTSPWSQALNISTYTQCLSFAVLSSDITNIFLQVHFIKVIYDNLKFFRPSCSTNIDGNENTLRGNSYG